MIYKYDRKYIHHRRILLYIALHWFLILLIAAAAFAFVAVKDYTDGKTEREELQAKYPDGYKTITYKINAVEKATLRNYE